MNIWTGLLFLEGAVADAPLARELAGDTTPTRDDRDPAAAQAESRGATAAAVPH